jgi:hypothetical protein
MKTQKQLLSLAALLVAGSLHINAQTITLWNFNSIVADATTSTGTTAPALGSGTATLLGGITGSFSSGDASGGSSDPATGDDSGWQTTTYAAPSTENKSRGLQFNVSTLGFDNIVVSFDTRHSNTSSKYQRFQYSTDGVNFVDSAVFAATAGDTWYNGRTADLSGIAGVNNNPNFAFRIVQEWESTATGAGADNFLASNPTATYAATGTWRFDMVQVTSVPEPTAFSLGMFGLAGLALWQRRGLR